MPTYNKQPIFTSTIILTTQTFDPPIAVDNYNAGAMSITPQLIHYGVYMGELIERITITSCGDLNNNIVNAKLIYLYTSEYNTGIWNLYKVGVLPPTTISATVPNPEIVWTFDGGFAMGLTTRNKLGIAASDNYSNTGERGDYLSVTLEGATYTY